MRRSRTKNKRKKGRKERKLHCLPKNPTGTSISSVRKGWIAKRLWLASLITLASYPLYEQSKSKETKARLVCQSLGFVCCRCLNNNFQCLNNIIHIFTYFFHLHVFLKNTSNIIRTILPNGPLILLNFFFSGSFKKFPHFGSIIRGFW